MVEIGGGVVACHHNTAMVMWVFLGGPIAAALGVSD